MGRRMRGKEAGADKGRACGVILGEVGFLWRRDSSSRGLLRMTCWVEGAGDRPVAPTDGDCGCATLRQAQGERRGEGWPQGTSLRGIVVVELGCSTLRQAQGERGTLTSVLSQDGRGGKKEGEGAYQSGGAFQRARSQAQASSCLMDRRSSSSRPASARTWAGLSMRSERNISLLAHFSMKANMASLGTGAPPWALGNDGCVGGGEKMDSRLHGNGEGGRVCCEGDEIPRLRFASLGMTCWVRWKGEDWIPAFAGMTGLIWGRVYTLRWAYKEGVSGRGCFFCSWRR